MTTLSPLPELRLDRTAPAIDEISPEAAVGRFEGNKNPGGAGIHTPPVFEKTWHSHAVKCLALRMTYEETANFCGVDKASVQLALRAPFFQARLREELSRTSTPLVELFQSSGVKAFLKIVDIMDDPKTPKATALASAKEIIDRCLGKAPQTIKHEEADAISDPVAAVEFLKQQNQALRTQLPN